MIFQVRYNFNRVLLRTLKQFIENGMEISKTSLLILKKLEQIPKHGGKTGKFHEEIEAPPKVKKQIFTTPTPISEGPRMTHETHQNKPQEQQHKDKKYRLRIPAMKLKKPSQIFEEIFSKLSLKPAWCPFNDSIRQIWKKYTVDLHTRRILTYDNSQSKVDRSKALKFGIQNSQEYSSGRGEILEYSEAKEYGDKVWMTQKNPLSLSGNENLADMRLTQKTKKLKDRKMTPRDTGRKTRSGLKSRKTKKKITNKAKKIPCKRRRRTNWFSKIPIVPNKKGSVIYANGSEQPLDDPCKILSVNFSSSILYPNEEPKASTQEVEKKSDVEKVSEDHDIVISRSYTPLHEKESFYGQYSSDPPLRRYLASKSNEPIIRQKKVSQLDNTVRCFTSTVKPEVPKTKKKKFLRNMKRSKSGVEKDTTENYYTFVENGKYPKTAPCDAYSQHYHDNTTGNIVLLFKKGDQIEEMGGEHPRKEDRENGGDTGESKCEIDVNTMKKDAVILPAVTRPVIQKPACLNLLQSKTLPSISSTWRNKGKKKDDNVRKTATNVRGRKTSTGIGGPSSDPWGTPSIPSVNYQQARLKSNKSASWTTRDDMKSGNPFHHLDQDQDEVAQEEELMCLGKSKECPITNQDLKNCPPHRNRSRAAAVNKNNFEECEKKLRSKTSCKGCETKPRGSQKCA